MNMLLLPHQIIDLKNLWMIMVRKVGKQLAVEERLAVMVVVLSQLINDRLFEYNFR